MDEPTEQDLPSELEQRLRDTLASARARTAAEIPHKVAVLEENQERMAETINRLAEGLGHVSTRVLELGAKFCDDTSPAFEEWLGTWADTYYQGVHIRDVFIDEVHTNSALFAELRSLWAYWLQAFGSPVAGEAQVRWHEAQYHFIRERLPFWILQRGDELRREAKGNPADNILQLRIDAARERAIQAAQEADEDYPHPDDEYPYTDDVEEVVKEPDHE
jgi:hypothetical protein